MNRCMVRLYRQLTLILNRELDAGGDLEGDNDESGVNETDRQVSEP